MFSGGDPGAGCSPDLQRGKRKSSSSFTFKRLVIFLVLFIAILSGLLLHLREAEWQKRRPAEDFCITHGLNRTNAELDNCIQNFLGLSAFFKAGGTPEELVESLMEQLESPAYATEVSQRSATEISQSYATQTSQNPHRVTETSQSRATEDSQWSATQLSQIRRRATEASQG